MTRKRTNSNLSLKRSAGVLMHITSLPGAYGIGDLGKEAKKFADFLKRSHQTYWQILPLNPTEESAGHSPYSSISSLAGNTLLISPESLVQIGLLETADLKSAKTKASDKVDFRHASSVKERLFDKAYAIFKKSKARKVVEPFETFCRMEKRWLDDFASYVVLKKKFENKPWFSWPTEYKKREKTALKNFVADNHDEVERVKWLQYIFFQQWNELKTYCNQSGVLLFGDLPFYVSYDSADVWSDPEIFSLDAKGKMKLVAGVPPDYFNEDGQLWGMPVFRWENLRKQNYSWWVRRIKKNMELFDVLRLDHFRAFAGYWAVPAHETTARNGTWKTGPGADLFETLENELGPLPFIAEDLGDIDKAVHDLRIKFQMPGMKVLQFAFGGNFATSDYIPHNFSENFVVYTGTHDNNTTRGWFKNDAGKIERENLKKYFQQSITAEKINPLLIRLAFSSVARIAITPAQDLLGLDEKSRMNAPATTLNNWQWRMLAGNPERSTEAWLKEQTLLYNRF